MNNIFVLYDSDCAFCVQCKHWIASQQQLVPVTFLASGSTAAKRAFPYMDHARTKVELTVISDEGWVYCDAKAWLMCLWTLKEYRSWAFRLASPELMPSAKSIIATIANNRKALSKMIA